MPKLIISKEILDKIGGADHGKLSKKDVHECFLNHNGKYARDHRPQHQAANGAPTYWFVGETNHRLRLKIMFVLENGDYYLKSAYPATPKVEALYAQTAK